MRRLPFVSLLLPMLLALPSLAEEPDLAARLSRYRPLLTSADREKRTAAYKAYREAGEEGRKLLAEALGSYRERVLAAVRGIALSAESQKKLLEVHTALAKARKEALRVIFDKKVYPDANHGRSGQPVVDKAIALVKAVLEHHCRAFGWTVKHSPRGLIFDSASGSVAKRFERVLAAHDRLCEIDEQLVFCDAQPEDFKAPLATLLEGRLHPDLLGALKELAEFNRYVRRCLRYNGLVETTTSSAERRVIDLTNEYRIQLGVRPLAINERLVQAARRHSQEMQRLNYFGHTSPTRKNRSAGDRCRNVGYKHFRGENCAYGSGADGSFRQWYNSSGHHRNMVNPSSNEIGVGHAGKWTEDFGANPKLDLENPPKRWDIPE